MSRTFEQLERRCLFSAASVTVDAMGLMKIVGTDADDTVTVDREGDTVRVVLNEQFTYLPTSSIKAIKVDTGKGNDTASFIVSAATSDLPITLAGGAGDDTLQADGPATLIGGEGSDSLKAINGDVTVDESDITTDLTLAPNGMLGDYTVTTVSSIDTFNATVSHFISGSGNDTITVRDGLHSIDGGAGNDTLDITGYNNITIHGGAGDDTFRSKYSGGSEVIYGDGGNDLFSINLDRSAHEFYGGEGIDSLDVSSMTVTSGRTHITLDDQANDTNSYAVYATYGVDHFYNDNFHSDFEKVIGGYANDYFSAEGLDHGVTLVGGSNNDTLVGGNGDDSLDGGASNDSLIGNGGNDKLLGGAASGAYAAGNDYLNGNSGDDSIVGNTGNDTIVGEDGNDTLVGGGGDDILDGGSGDNTLVTSATPTWYSLVNGVLTINLTDGNDVGTIYYISDGNPKTIRWVATFNNEQKTTLASLVKSVIVNGNGGDDNLHNLSLSEHATLNGGDGNDTLTGGLGGDFIDGGAGDDEVYSGRGNDVIRGGDGNDTIIGGGGIDLMFGGAGDDLLEVTGASYMANYTFGETYMFGQDGNDTLIGGGSKDRLDGGVGDDSVVGNDGDDELAADGGSDTLIGGAGNNTTVYAPILDPTDSGGSNTGGTPATPSVYTLSNGVLTINGTAKSDNVVLSYHNANGKLFVTFNGSVVQFVGSRVSSIVINGNAGSDKIDATYANVATRIYGGAGSDLIYGSNFADRIYGGDDADYIYALGGNDIVYGEAGNDRLFGGAGLDHIDGGAGTNVLRGEDGKDTLTYRSGDNIAANQGDYLSLAPNLA